MKTLLSCCFVVAGAVAQQAPVLTHGPFRGPVDDRSMHVWARADRAGDFTLQLTNVVDGSVVTAAAAASAAHDFTLHFAVAGLPPASAFTARIQSGGQQLYTSAAGAFITALPDDAAAACIAFGSCAHDKKFPEQPIWPRILTHAPQALVLLGDTPYIDLGTVEARRQRYREFFALPAIAATLGAIPTVSTWDDHDYALNDQFGAMPSAATARSVFVDYHAHAGYGEHGRGVYTRFRQGPIEVFVLDTRSFADGDGSLLAPGERTLLGRAQTAWLQRSLTASTAPCKVLACGMVWNDGVRPGKLDCWGNWLPERDGLFRWLGEHRIDGVVLVGGDVHRSRVIVHPTRDLAGYDIPEFVTSPLAQDVIEANAVPVRGLEFDGGEPSSCLLLTAQAGADGVAVRATFVAGDGREFHRREFAAGALVRQDAAAQYRQIAASLREMFGADHERLPEVDHAAEGMEPSGETAVAPAWRDTVARAAPVFAAWRTAANETRCRFRATSGEAMQPEFLHDLLRPFLSLQRLAAARACQAIADDDVGVAGETVSLLLASARHLQQDPSGLAWSLATTFERDAAALQRALADQRGEAAAATSRAAIARHLQQRGGIASLGAALRAEAWQLFDGSIGQLRLGADRQAQVARMQVDAVRRHFGTRLDAYFGAFDRATDSEAAAVAATLRQQGQELQALAKARRVALQALRGQGAAGVDAAEELGLLMATLLLPSGDGLVEALDASRLALLAVGR